MSPKSPTQAVKPVATAALLRESSPDWVARIGQGANWMFLGLLLSFCTSSLAKRVPYAGPIIDLLPDVAWFAGVWMLTTREPGKPQVGVSIRRVTRGVSVLGIAFDVVAAGLSYGQDPDSLFLRGVALILGAVQLLCIAFLMAALAERIPDLRLARQSRFVITALAVISLLLGGFAVYVTGNVSVRDAVRGNTAIILAAIPVLLVTFVFGFWFLWILHRIHRVASEAAALASPE